MRNIKKQSIQGGGREVLAGNTELSDEPDYVNPNVPMRRAKEIIARLQKEYYLGYLID